MPLLLIIFYQRDFLAVEMADGKVRVTFDLGSGVLALMSKKRYNNGTWFKIAFQRNRKLGKTARQWAIPPFFLFIAGLINIWKNVQYVQDIQPRTTL